MDYEKLHNETLAKLQRLVGDYKITEETARFICADFVAESEDERIINEIIHTVTGYHPIHTTEEIENMVAYLEKQKEQKGSLRVIKDASEWEKIKEQKPAEWSEEDKRNLYNTIEAIKYTFDVSEGSGGSRLIAWLKFHLRPLPNWKPSEE